MDLNKLANVIDALADYVEAQETEKIASVVAAKEKMIASVCEKYSALTGEPISDDLLEKLASADESLLETIDKVAESKKDSERLGVLGAPSDKHDLSVEPTNKKEAAAIADERFLSWILE